jgi:hypothetical protein
MITIAQALSSLRPNAAWAITGNVYTNIIWMDTTQTKPTENEVQDEITRLTLEEPYTACTNEAKKRLAASDWSVLPDVNISNKAEFETYRAALRTLMFTPVVDPIYPTEPQPIWV